VPVVLECAIYELVIVTSRRLVDIETFEDVGNAYDGAELDTSTELASTWVLRGPGVLT
jgi:hypothetical protein